MAQREVLFSQTLRVPLSLYRNRKRCLVFFYYYFYINACPAASRGCCFLSQSSTVNASTVCLPLGIEREKDPVPQCEMVLHQNLQKACVAYVRLNE